MLGDQNSFNIQIHVSFTEVSHYFVCVCIFCFKVSHAGKREIHVANNLWLITRGSPHVYGQKELEILMSKTKVARISYLTLSKASLL